MALPFATYTTTNGTVFLDASQPIVPIHPQADGQRAYSVLAYKFISNEEQEEYLQRYRDARIGDKTTGEQKNAGDRIYNLILMKRRMRARMNKKK
jgi:hypothetical protein